MRINSVNNTNFRGVYLVTGVNAQRDAFQSECKKYPKKLTYMPVGRDKIEILKDKNKAIYNWAKNIDIEMYGKKTGILVTGSDFKEYKKGTKGYENSNELMKKVHGLISLPVWDREREVKDLALKHPDKFVNSFCV